MDRKRRLAGWVWMLIGLAIIAYTKFILTKAPGSKLRIFFYIGILFLIIGALKEFLPRLTGKKRVPEHVGPPAREEPQHHHPAQQPAASHPYQGTSAHGSHHVTGPAYPSHPYQPLHKPCPRCHQVNHGRARFCHACGYRFF